MKSKEEVEMAVADLLDEVRQSTLTRAHLNELLDSIGTSSKSAKSAIIAKLTLAFCIFAACAFFLSSSSSQCLVALPFDRKNVFRPPVDCAVCRRVVGVDIVSDITPNNFTINYAYTGRPVVVKDALVNWTAKDTFTYDFFGRLYDTYGSAERSDRCQFFPYKTEFHSLRQALSMSKERMDKPWYFGWSNCDSEAADELRQHYSRPYFLPPLSESSRTDWIFIGTSGLGAHLHVDHVGLPSWQAQIRGKKLWTLEPPPECFYQCQPMEVIVEPGDTIVLDTNIWYHKTSVVSEEHSITIGSEYD